MDLKPLEKLLERYDRPALERFHEEEELLSWIDYRDDNEAIMIFSTIWLAPGDRLRLENLLQTSGLDDSNDAVLNAVATRLAPDYVLSLWLPSLGSDTLAFLLLPAADWQSLTQRFGPEKIAGLLQPLTGHTAAFGLDFDAVEAQLMALNARFPE